MSINTRRFGYSPLLSIDACYPHNHKLTHKCQVEDLWSTLIQVMAWCLAASSHNLNQCCIEITDIYPNVITQKCASTVGRQYHQILCFKDWGHLPGDDELIPDRCTGHCLTLIERTFQRTTTFRCKRIDCIVKSTPTITRKKRDNLNSIWAAVNNDVFFTSYVVTSENYWGNDSRVTTNHRY